MVLRTALNGEMDGHGLKHGLEIYFSYGEFYRGTLNKKMFAEFYDNLHYANGKGNNCS